MIFYFSGTGNSRWVARQLGRRLGEGLTDITEAVGKQSFVYRPENGERILFVFPVHAWGLPLPVRSFIKKLKPSGISGYPAYLVCTCGDDCGRTDRMARRLLRKNGWDLQAAFSVQMPNNYILLPGFDVDPHSLAVSKLEGAVRRVEEIGSMIAGERPLRPMYTAGRWAGAKTGVVYPLFRWWASRKPAFYATGSCISCGLCARVCPTGTIAFDGGTPDWGRHCVQCLACIHRCPVRAIEYGTITSKKGRYCHPGEGPEKEQPESSPLK